MNNVCVKKIRELDEKVKGLEMEIKILTDIISDLRECVKEMYENGME